MNANTYRAYAAERVAEAQRTLAAHSAEAYTGICRSCGRPGPCDEQRAARTRLAHYGDTADDLRDAWLATIAASDRAGARLHGAGPPGRRLAWQDAVTECWRALALVHAGLGEVRASAGSVGELVAGLRAARADADRAATLAASVRRRLSAAEDRLRRTGTPADQVAARRFAAAVSRLDLVAARLAVGGRTIDRYVAALTGQPEPMSASPTPALATDEIARGTRAARHWSSPGAAGNTPASGGASARSCAGSCDGERSDGGAAENAGRPDARP